MFEFRKHSPTPVIYKAMRSDNSKLSVHIPYVEGMRQELKEVLDGGHLNFNSDTKMWEMSANHIETVADFLLMYFGEVELQITTSTVELCTTQCQTAKFRPVSECECVCGGHNHGDGWPEGWKLASAKGDLIVRGERKTEIFTLKGDSMLTRPAWKDDEPKLKWCEEVMWGGRPAMAYDDRHPFAQMLDLQEVK